MAAVIHSLDMVVVLLADPQIHIQGGRAWRDEKTNFNLVANFVAALDD